MADFQISMVPIGDFKEGIKDTAKLFVVLQGATRDAVAEGARYMATYPTKPPGSSYIRTGKLGQSWDFNVKSGSGNIEGQTYSTGNTAPYNENVQGENQMPVFKRIGWRTTEDLRKQFDTKFADNVQKEIDKYFK